MRSAVVLLVLALATAGCRFDSAPAIPLAGPPPRLVLVAPARTADAMPGPTDYLLAGADRALRARGYEVIDLGAGFDLIAAHGLAAAVWSDGPELAQVPAATHADAVLRVFGRRFEYEQDAVLRSAHYDVSWQLVAADGALLWHFEMGGAYWPERTEGFDPTARPTDVPPVRPLGQPRPRRFRDVAEFVAALHYAALDHLPRRP